VVRDTDALQTALKIPGQIHMQIIEQREKQMGHPRRLALRDHDSTV
jgi:hypothetical protein